MSYIILYIQYHSSLLLLHVTKEKKKTNLFFEKYC